MSNQYTPNPSIVNNRSLISPSKDGTYSIEYSEIPDIKLKLQTSIIDLTDEVTKRWFLEGCEKLIRKDKEYESFIAQAIKEYKMDKNSMNVKITGKMAKLELHHGPIFKLYDYCELELNKRILSHEHDWTTFDIAQSVMDIHFDGMVQFVRIDQDTHKECHPKKDTVRPRFIPLNVVAGDLEALIKHYKGCFTERLQRIFWNYRTEAIQYQKMGTGYLHIPKMVLYVDDINKLNK